MVARLLVGRCPPYFDELHELGRTDFQENAVLLVPPEIARKCVETGLVLDLQMNRLPLKQLQARVIDRALHRLLR